MAAEYEKVEGPQAPIASPLPPMPTGGGQMSQGQYIESVYTDQDAWRKLVGSAVELYVYKKESELEMVKWKWQTTRQRKADKSRELTDYWAFIMSQYETGIINKQQLARIGKYYGDIKKMKRSHDLEMRVVPDPTLYPQVEGHPLPPVSQ